jgi:hypothetical protein
MRFITTFKVPEYRSHRSVISKGAVSTPVHLSSGLFYRFDCRNWDSQVNSSAFGLLFLIYDADTSSHLILTLIIDIESKITIPSPSSQSFISLH